MFKKLIISEQLIDLVTHHHDAFILLTIIAIRARRKPFHGLEARQAQIGDWKKCGFTEQRYRSTKRQLAEYGIATFKTTNKGTIATLCDSRYYDINEIENNGQDNEQITNQQRTNNEQITCNKKKEVRSKEVRSKDLKEKRGRFTPPMPSQVDEYIAEYTKAKQITLDFDGDKFCANYEAVNWFRGKTKISDWKGCVRYWVSNHNSKPEQQPCNMTVFSKRK